MLSSSLASDSAQHARITVNTSVAKHHVISLADFRIKNEFNID